MPGSLGEVTVRGLSDLNRAFAQADATMRLEFKKELKDAVEIVRRDATKNAVSNIRNITPQRRRVRMKAGRKRLGKTVDWSEMRIGVTYDSVYVAPKQRGITRRGGDPRKRPNLAPLLANEMEAALDQNRERIVRQVDGLLDEIERKWGSGG